MDITTTAEAGAAACPSETRSLLRLITWLSPAFPVGGFAYSGGLERAVADGLIRDAAGLDTWIRAVLERGSAWNDGVILREAHRCHCDADAIAGLSELAIALASGRERQEETLALGTAFIEAARNWPHPVFSRLPDRLSYPVAVGVVAAAHRIAPVLALAAYFSASAAQAVSAGIRLSALGQREGVRLVANLEPPIEALATRAAATTLDDLGGGTILADICGLRHETQPTRLFRS